MSEKDFVRKKNKHLPKVMEYVKENGGDVVIPYSAAFEQNIFDLPPEDQEKVCFVRHVVGATNATGLLPAAIRSIVQRHCAMLQI